MKNVIKTTRVVSGYGCISGWDSSTYTCSNPDNNGNNFTVSDKVYLLSGVELTGTDPYDTAASTTHQLDYYVGQPIEPASPCGPGCDGGGFVDSYPRTKKQYNSSYLTYWIRTVYPVSTFGFSDSCSYGYLSNIYAEYEYNGMAPAFRIG